MSTPVASSTGGIWETILAAVDRARELFGLNDPSEADVKVSEIAMTTFSSNADPEKESRAVRKAPRTAAQPCVDPQPRSSEVTMAQIPSIDNGDCLYGAIATYMSLSGSRYQPSPFELRELAAGLIQAELTQPSPDERLITFMDHAIIEHNESIDRKYNDEKANLLGICSIPGLPAEQVRAAAQELEKLESSYQQNKIFPKDFHAYAAKVKNRGFFANSPEMYVLAKELNIPIQIYGPGSSPESFREMPASFNRKANSPVCSLLYSPMKRHFDLLIGS